MSSLAELVARLRSMKVKPTLICLNETWLDPSTKKIELEGYVLISRRDRQDGRKCGGVAVLALENRAASVSELRKSEKSERVWVLVHSDLGPYIVAAWYRPPEQGETASIDSLREEWNELSSEAVGAIITGDMNIHHQSG